MRLSIILVFVPFLAICQPDWLSKVGRLNRYPENDYFIGYTARNYSSGETYDKVLAGISSQSYNSLFQQIRASVFAKSQYLQSKSNSSEMTFQEECVTQEALTAYGMERFQYVDSTSQTAHGISVISKRNLVKGYYLLLSDEMNSSKELINRALESDDIKEKYNLLSKSMGLLNNVKGLQDLMMILGLTNEVVIMRRDWYNLHHLAVEEMEKISDLNQTSLESQVRYLLDDLANEVADKYRSFYLMPIEFKNSGIPTELSESIYTEIQIKAQRNFDLQTDPNSQYRFGGSYWIIEDQVTVTLNLSEFDGEELVRLIYSGGFSFSTDVGNFRQISFEPSMDSISSTTHHAILDNTLENGGVSIKMATQKGRNNLLFNRGEVFELFLEASRPVYIRMINILPDGAVISLLDNYYISKQDINKTLNLDFEWEAVCPCGTEYVKVFAQNEPFEPIEIYRSQYFDMINMEVEELVHTVRAEQSSKSQLADFYFAEDGISFTTME